MNEETPTVDATRRTLGPLRAAMAVCLALALFAAAGAIAVLVVSRGPAALAPRGGAAATVQPSTRTVTQPDWRQVGVSVQGRPILVASFGSGERRVLMVGGIHGSEFGSDVADQFVIWLRTNPAALPAGTRLDVVACANPDGRVAGTRGNAHAVNLNGNFPTRNWKQQKYRTTTAGPRAGSEPETQALMHLLESGYVRVVSLHSQGGFIDYDGPNGRALASQVASASGMPVKKLGPPQLYAGSLGTYVPERFGVPVLTVELSSRVMTPGVLAGLLASIR